MLRGKLLPWNVSFRNWSRGIFVLSRDTKVGQLNCVLHIMSKKGPTLKMTHLGSAPDHGEIWYLWLPCYWTVNSLTIFKVLIWVLLMQHRRAAELNGGNDENSTSSNIDSISTSGSRIGDVIPATRDTANDKLTRFQRPEHRQVN